MHSYSLPSTGPGQDGQAPMSRPTRASTTPNGSRSAARLGQQGDHGGALNGVWKKSKHRQPDDFVFATREGTPTKRRSVLRHLKQVAKAHDIPKGIDFRRFRTMHASLMRRSGARPEVARDNMGHSEIPMTLEGYSRTWWDERARCLDAPVANRANDKAITSSLQANDVIGDLISLLSRHSSCSQNAGQSQIDAILVSASDRHRVSLRRPL
jgi:hypothetical protein